MEYLTLAIVGFFAALTPGPDIFFVIKEGLVRRNLAFVSVFGILCGNIIYLTLVALGLSKIGESVYFQFIIGMIGGIYLLKISYLTFKEKVNLKVNNKIYSLKETFKKAFFLNLSNPKAMLFFVAVVAPFMGDDLLLSIGSLFLGISSAFLLAAFISSKIEIKEKVLNIINKISSIIFLFFSIKLFIYAYNALLMISKNN